MSDWRGDYMGFTYNGVHSSDLGIVRTSDGSRFNENLLPTMQDKTVQVPGGDGTYYFGSYYTQRQFSVSFAFDSLTEEQVATLRKHFGDKKIHDLIFDEVPYKVYSAKVTGTATLKYIPFAEGATNRLYKGEGTIQFTCFYPFARCWSSSREDYANHPAYKNLDSEKREKRIDEWWEASRIQSINENGELIGNFGDIPVSFKLTVSGTGSKEFGGPIIEWKIPEGQSATLDTRTGLATTSKGVIMNKYFTGDLTLKIPVGLTKKRIGSANFTCEYI